VAINHQLTLATRNSKDFDPARHSFVAIPYLLNVK
jgi:predicted nucleic acid-binding protein